MHAYVLPGDVLLAQGLEDRRGAGGPRDVVEEPGGLLRIVHKATGRARGRKLAIGVGRTRVLSKLYLHQLVPLSSVVATHIRVEESKVLCQFCQKRSLLLAIRFDDKGRITRSGVVLLGLALDKTCHIGDVVVGDIPLAEDLIGDAGKYVVGILQRDFRLVGGGTDLQRFPPHGPLGIRVLVAEGNVAQVVNVRMKVPVAGDIVK